jgi:hypothetical protein
VNRTFETPSGFCPSHGFVMGAICAKCDEQHSALALIHTMGPVSEAMLDLLEEMRGLVQWRIPRNEECPTAVARYENGAPLKYKFRQADERLMLLAEALKALAESGRR